MAQLYEILVESIVRNLRLIGSSFENQLEVEDAELRLPEPLHFKPLNFGHLLTLVYPIGMSSSETCMHEFVFLIGLNNIILLTLKYYKHSRIQEKFTQKICIRHDKTIL